MKRKFVGIIVLCMLLITSCSFLPDINQQQKDGLNSVDDKKEDVSNNNSVDQLHNMEQSNETQQEETMVRYTTFYYQDNDGLLIPITRKTVRVEGIGKAAINSLVDVPVIREDVGRVGLYPVLPSDLRINGMTIRDGLAILDLNEQILKYQTEQNERNIIDSIVYTLSEFHTIDRVQLLINGEKYNTLKFGTPISTAISRQGINSINIDQSANESNKEIIEVYYTKLIHNKYLYYVPVSKEINSPTSDANRYMKTLDKLIRGDIGYTSLKSYVPEKSSLQGIQVDGQTVILDFNDAILNATESDTSFNIMLKQILLSFKQFGKVKKIKITVNGKSIDLPQQYGGRKELKVPDYANQFQ